MFNLASILFAFISATVVGIFFIAALVTGYDTLVPLLIAVAVGFVVALPITYFVTKAIMDEE